ncbi:putative glycoside hydrolase [Nocardia tenerifensis]|uniref:putative glycoside hydrolase n=1 Tax=Nocardia tenerifensis TaxID=228006 RepID=UPI0003170029|nr:putative glycoside hydrolase [Nocardia tenerifensis]
MTLSSVRTEPHGLTLSGLPSNYVGSAALSAMTLRVDAGDNDPHALRLELDGHPVDGAVDGNTVVYRPGALPDGEHKFTAEIPPDFLGFLRTGPGASETFTVDTEAPTLELTQPTGITSYRQPVTLRGKTTGAERVSVGAQSVTPADDGSFEIDLPRAQTGADVVAVDAAGNQTAEAITATIEQPPIKAVHVTAYGWSDDGLREDVLDMARDGRINTVQLDIKDEDGVVGYDSRVPLARESGAATPIYDAPAALRQLHDMNIRVVGRIVAFRDKTMAEWAWQHGHSDWVIQNPSGQPYASKYGPIAFTNFADPQIRRYNIDLAVEGAKLGFDGIMYDYIRRPDGALTQMQFPGSTESPTVSIAEFLRESRDPVRDAGAEQSAAVFGIASTRPEEIAQDIPAMAKYVDYIAPMVYPSHWNAGEYGVANPNSQPYDITLRSLQDFHAQTQGTAAKVVPWLQDFSLGVGYGPGEVRAQIDAAKAAGTNGFFLWSPTVHYHLTAGPTD